MVGGLKHEKLQTIPMNRSVNLHVSYGVPEDNLSVVPRRTASGQKYLQPTDVENLVGPVGLTAGHLQEH